MTSSPIRPASAYYAPPTAQAGTGLQLSGPTDNEPPQKPDWLLIMVVALFVVTLSVAWLVSMST